MQPFVFPSGEKKIDSNQKWDLCKVSIIDGTGKWTMQMVKFSPILPISSPVENSIT